LAEQAGKKEGRRRQSPLYPPVRPKVVPLRIILTRPWITPRLGLHHGSSKRFYSIVR
jgi:hypothetical protein